MASTKRRDNCSLMVSQSSSGLRSVGDVEHQPSARHANSFPINVVIVNRVCPAREPPARRKHGIFMQRWRFHPCVVERLNFSASAFIAVCSVRAFAHLHRKPPQSGASPCSRGVSSRPARRRLSQRVRQPVARINGNEIVRGMEAHLCRLARWRSILSLPPPRRERRSARGQMTAMRAKPAFRHLPTFPTSWSMVDSTLISHAIETPSFSSTRSTLPAPSSTTSSTFTRNPTSSAAVLILQLESPGAARRLGRGRQAREAHAVPFRMAHRSSRFLFPNSFQPFATGGSFLGRGRWW